MKVKKLIHHKLETVKPDTNITDVAKKMSSTNIGAVPVVANDKVVGIITDRDITIRVTAELKDPNITTASSVMSDDVQTCFEDDDIEKCAELMRKNQVGRILVVDHDQKPLGIVNLRDLANQPESHDLASDLLSSVPSKKTAA